ncbi:glycosyltransferase [Tepidimonas charontis]|uniref:Chondroitin synthase n=1 Tax=Tepidimonas charontis TaxID=2267262 RepID=A0A554XCA0_9BURK|nr:glycosyltransferase [Tepidimonas charontis]TSE33465.1 Chondroitin synthase [Tepidimonas charontis]
MTIEAVSVVIPAYNHEAYVAQAVRSALAYPLVGEVWVCDDASTDRTWEVLQQLTDPRLIVTRHSVNQGAHATLGALLDRAQGPYLAVLNSDDLFLPGRLQRCVDVLQAGQADLVGTDIQLIDAAGNEITDHWWVSAFAALKAVWRETGDWVATLLEGNVFMTTSNFVFTRALWQRLRPFSADRYVHDYDFLLRAVAAGARLAWVDEPLLAYRLHGANTISESPLAANLEAAALLRRHLGALLALPGPLAQRVAHLNSQWARIEGYEVQILRDQAQRQVQTLQVALAQHEQKLSECERRVSERDAALRHAQLQARAWAWRATNAMSTSAPARARSRKRWQQLLRAVRQQLALARTVPAGASLHRVNGFAALRRLVQQRPALQAISVDVFDTLVARCVEPPDDIVRQVAARLADRLGVPEHADYVLHMRREAEYALRQAALADGYDHECHHDELVHAWLARLLPDWDDAARAALAEWVEQTELELERLALQPKANAHLFLQWAKAQGLRVLAISDMYLGQRHLRQLLGALGYADLIDHIYVSSEHRMGKYSARLFQHVLHREGLPPEAVLHVGDNVLADAVAPARLGLTGVFLDERRERARRRRQALSARMAASGGIWPGRRVAEVIAQRLQADPRARRDDPYFQYGLEVLGPVFATFMAGLLERVKTDRPQRLLFLARDGYLFYHMYADAVRHLPGPWPEAAYICVSRAVAAQAAVAEGLDAERAAVALYNPKQQGLWSILKTYGLPPEEFADLAREHGLQPMQQPLRDRNDPRLRAFLDDERVQSRVRPLGEQARARLHRYFAQHGFFSCECVALVDIGWNATIQRFLEKAFAAHGPYPTVHGYYFAYVHAIHQDALSHGSIEGLMYDRRRGNAHERAPLDFEELFEQAARAPHGTTIGYQEVGETVQPIFKDDAAPDRQAELRCNPSIQALQDGVMLYWEHMLAAQTLTGADFAALKPYAMALAERAVVYPTPQEVQLIAALAHTEDFGHEHLLELAPAPLRWTDWLHPARLKRQLAAPWPFARFARLPSLALKLAMRWTHLRSIRRRHPT